MDMENSPDIPLDSSPYISHPTFYAQSFLEVFHILNFSEICNVHLMDMRSW